MLPQRTEKYDTYEIICTGKTFAIKKIGLDTNYKAAISMVIGWGKKPWIWSARSAPKAEK